ncbi:MAG TPA: ribosome maturation factor RimP [Bacillales bacterium]|nr:ribosome maturation factor RimP [Bacillales bacterium]
MGEKVTDVTERLVHPILENLNLELVDVEFVKEGKNWYLRVYIDSDNGVDLDACTDVSEKLSQELDEENLIEHPYFLEVSSPGAERPLKKEKDFRDAIGKAVRITTYAPIDGEKAFEGELLDFDGDRLQLIVKQKTKQKQVDIPRDKVASARLAVTFH